MLSRENFREIVNPRDFVDVHRRSPAAEAAPASSLTRSRTSLSWSASTHQTARPSTGSTRTPRLAARRWTAMQFLRPARRPVLAPVCRSEKAAERCMPADLRFVDHDVSASSAFSAVTESRPWQPERQLRGRPRRPRSRGLGEALALHVLDQQRQCAVEHLAGIGRWHRVPQQSLRAAELVVNLARHRELNPAALRCERRNARGRDNAAPAGARRSE
jgi:hypothetical protein